MSLSQPGEGACPAMPASPKHNEGFGALHKKSSMDTNPVTVMLED